MHTHTFTHTLHGGGSLSLSLSLSTNHGRGAGPLLLLWAHSGNGRSCELGFLVMSLERAQERTGWSDKAEGADDSTELTFACV